MKYVRIGISLAVFFVVFISLYIPTNDYVVWVEDGVVKTYENEKIETLEEKIIRLVDTYATGTKAYEMKKTIYCESGYKNIQSNIVKNGVREDSWGVAQINLYYHPQVTKEQAMNEEFAVKWMSDNWGKVKWYGYIRNTDSCNEIY